MSAPGAEVSIIPVVQGEGPVKIDAAQLPDSLPILALRNAVLFPGTVYPITIGREKSIRLIEDADMNVTFTGGDPMLHPEGFTALARMIKEKTDKTIWCYTGYSFEELLKHPARKALAELCDIIVDGRYIEAQRDLSLHFRGSRNQRIIDVKQSLKGTIHTVEY